VERLIDAGQASAVLLVSGSIFPRGHIQSALLKGIDPGQQVVNIPSQSLSDGSDTNAIPGLIGARMAASTGLQIGDYVSARWRNVHGTFDAADIRIVQIMNTNVPTIDKDQIWIPLSRLQKMLQTPGEATIVTVKKDMEEMPPGNADWIVRDRGYLFRDIDSVIRQKKVSASFMFILLTGMALLAVFDTQVLSIFRRRKEMGTLMALGMTRWNVIALFTFEGCLLGLLALIAGAVYGVPFLSYLATTGITLPQMTRQVGFAIGSTVYPKYGLQLYAMTSLILFTAVVIVSFLPTRRITKLKPTDALRGKLS
jgi:ABC-type lipoprotein release transport system permease subunit